MLCSAWARSKPFLWAVDLARRSVVHHVQLVQSDRFKWQDWVLEWYWHNIVVPPTY